MLNRYCEYCGKDINDSEVFCPFCGSIPVAVYPISSQSDDPDLQGHKSVA